MHISIISYTLNDPENISEKQEVEFLVTEMSSNKQETNGSWKLLVSFMTLFCEWENTHLPKALLIVAGHEIKGVLQKSFS